MIFWGSIILISIISIILAIRSASFELSPPPEVSKLKISKKKSFSGVILFLKKKIVHYYESSSS